MVKGDEMSQLIIEFRFDGGFKRKYYGLKTKYFKSINVPEKLKGKDWIIGIERDFSDKWRERLDNHTKNAEYEIIKIQ